MSTVDPKRCPLCGQDNQCGVVAGKGTCWCFSRPVPEEILDRLPPEARDVACICESCAAGRRDTAKTMERMRQILRER